MPFTIIDVLYSGLVPAVMGVAAWLLARRVLSEDTAARLAPALALLIGFAAGYWLQWWKDEHTYWLPKFAYDWLPVLVVFAAIWGPVVHAHGVSRFERLLAYIIFGLIVAWFLVPTRKDLEPMRWTYVLTLGPSLGLIATLFDGICERFRGPLLPGQLSFTAMCLSVILLLSGSTSFSLTAGAGAAALAGIAIALFWKRGENLRGLSLAYCTLLCGGAIIGELSTSSDVPLASYIIPPFAPLLMWCAVRGPLSRGSGFVGGLKKVALPVIACLVAVGLAVLADLKANAP